MRFHCVFNAFAAKVFCLDVKKPWPGTDGRLALQAILIVVARISLVIVPLGLVGFHATIAQTRGSRAAVRHRRAGRCVTHLTGHSA